MITNNYQNQLNYGAVKDVIPQQVNQKLPQSVQNYDVRESVQGNTAVKAAKDAKKDPITLGLTGAIWLGLAQFCQGLNNKLNCKWEESWLGKVGNWAEKFSLKHFPNGGNGKIKNFFSGLIDKSAILRCIKTPTKAQNGLAVSQSRGITGYVMNDVNSMLNYHLQNGHGDDIVKLLDGITDINGKTGKEALDFIDDLFKNCEQNQSQIQKLIKNLANAPDTKVSVDYLTQNRFFKIPNIPFLKREGSFKEMANKLNAVFENSAGLGKQATNLGKSLPRQALKTLEGLTNGGAGGKIMIVIQAAMFAQAIREAMDAPEGEKLSTFSENVANDFGYFLSIPLQVKASHAIGGLKYIGINGAKNAAEQAQSVNTYRNMIKNLNTKVDAGTISHIDYLKESKKIKEFLNGNSKWYQKPFKLLGKIFSTGLDAETIKPFVDNADKSLGTSMFNSIKNFANKLKGPYFGTVLRFAVGAMVVGPLVAKCVVKVSHLIFGRPTKSIIDKDKEETKTQNNNEISMTQEEMMQKLAANPELMKKMENDPQFLNQLLENPELMVKYLNGELKVENNQQNSVLNGANSKYIIQNNTPKQQANIPSQPQVQQNLSALNNNSQSKMDLFGLGKKKEETPKQEENKQDSLEPTRTYIPSSECMVKTDGQNQELDPNVNSAILNAEKIEKRALEQLNNL